MCLQALHPSQLACLIQQCHYGPYLILLHSQGCLHSPSCQDCILVSRVYKHLQFFKFDAIFALFPVPHSFATSSLISSHPVHHTRFGPELFPAFHRHPYAMLHPHLTGVGKRKKSWTRAVFSNLQRKGLEKRFQMQKYITKPDRRQLAASLGLTDAQVSVPKFDW